MLQISQKYTYNVLSYRTNKKTDKHTQIKTLPHQIRRWKVKLKIGEM